MNLFIKSLLYEQSFDDIRLDTIESMRGKNLVPPRIFDFFVAVEQHHEIIKTNDGALWRKVFEWMIKAYAGRHNHGLSKETVVNAVIHAGNEKKLDALVRHETLEGAVAEFMAERDIQKYLENFPEEYLLHQDGEWILVKIDDEDFLGIVRTPATNKWEIAKKYGASHFENNGGRDGAYVFLLNKIFSSPTLNFLMKMQKSDNLKIYDGRYEITDADSIGAIDEFIDEHAFQLNTSVKEALRNTSFVRRKYDIDQLREMYRESEYDNYRNTSDEQLVESLSWSRIFKYVDVKNFISKYEDDIRDMTLKDAFNNNAEELVDAIMLSVAKWKLQEEFNGMELSEIWKYMVDNYHAIDFDTLVENMSYGYIANLVDVVKAKAGYGKFTDVENGNQLARALGIDPNNESRDYIKKKVEELEERYSLFSDLVDWYKMSEDTANEASEDDLIEMYGEVTDDESDI